MKYLSRLNGINWKECFRTNLEGKKQPNWLKPGDILFQTRGQDLFAVTVDEFVKTHQVVASSNLYVIRLKRDDVLSDYLGWWLNQKEAQNYLKRFSQGSAIALMPRHLLGDVSIEIPPLHIQQKIVQLSEAMKKQERLSIQLAQDNHSIMAAISETLNTSNNGAHHV